MPGIGRWDSCYFACAILWCLANALLLVVCWLPPILPLRVKALLTTLYLATAALWLVDWEDILPDLVGAAGLGGLLKGVNWSEWTSGARWLGEVGFVLLALAVLIGVAFDVSVRHHSTTLSDADDERAGGET